MATTIEQCKYQFEKNEIAEISETLARKISETELKEAEKKDVASQFATQIKTLQNEMSAAAACVRNGYEYRGIECDVLLDYANNAVNYVRQDTGETVRTRVMTAAERQEEMQIDG